MAKFEIAASITLSDEIEGGYQNLKSDKGNFNSKGQRVGTNHGISAETFEDYFKRPPTKSDMMNLSKKTALKIMKEKFWLKKANGDKIKNQVVANVFFDGCVNHGRGVFLMQEILGIKQDGKVGPVTLAAINNADPEELVEAYLERRVLYFKQIVKNDSSQKPNLNGWLERINRLRDMMYQTSTETFAKIEKEVKENPAKTGLVIGATVALFLGFSYLVDNYKA